MIQKQSGKRVGCILLAIVLAVLLCAPAASADEGSAQLPALSQGQQNIVKRARQMTEICWMPDADVVGWKSEFTYRAGTTYWGLPYGQPVYASFVPWEASLLEFIRAVNSPDSKMYTSYSEYAGRAPYYSVDCSGFVSWAWGLSSRQTTRTLKEFATKISEETYVDAQVGDSLCLAGVHAVLITDITYDENGVINGIEISEATTNLATDYCCQVTHYGKNGTRTLQELTLRYFGNGYILYRCKTRDSVTYSHSCAVPLEGDVCSDCSAGEYSVTPEHLSVMGRQRVTLYAQPRKNAVTVGGVPAGSEIVVTGSWTDAGEALWYQTRSGAWLSAEGMQAYCRHDYQCTETVKPTCKAPGVGEFVCFFCGDTQTRELPVADHSYENGSCIWCGAGEPEILTGDLTGDGSVTEEDVIHLLWYTIMADDYPLNQNGDYSGDGFVTEEDVIRLLWYTIDPETYPLT